MDSHPSPPVGEVRYLPGGGFYVQACHPGVSFCPKLADGATSSALLDAVDAIDSDDKEELVEVPSAVRPGGSSLLNALYAISSDDSDDDESAAASEDDDDELHDKQPRPSSVVLRARSVVSSAALDLYPLVNLTSFPDTDSSSSSEEEFDDDEDFDDSGSEDGMDSERVDKHTASSTPRTLSWECDQLSVDQMDSIIRSNMAEIEAKKPWRFVFRCLVVPFNFKRSEDPFDVFFMRWDDFWRLHGRAVWERAFWQPLIPGSTAYYRRKWRQTRAQRAFSELATDLVDRLGEPYLRWLRKALHEGWWYRTEPFALRRLFLRDRKLYEEYLLRRVKERWPRGRKFLVERGLKPIWWRTGPSSTSP
ncbi:unnamed protein product [Phytophthora lilii]|uniref:Unnamed protein product n=1 Tax=Phytophthora lilii TaxID=2077276 RepID=A0A9W6WVP6_9STRA|nr:unnamed protein product [Phytophthora lilii]